MARKNKKFTIIIDKDKPYWWRSVPDWWKQVPVEEWADIITNLYEEERKKYQTKSKE